MLFIILRLVVFHIHVVNAEDMADTLHIGDKIIINKLSISYERNDMLCFHRTDNDSVDAKIHFLQRCIGIPGDTLLILDNIVFTNDSMLEDPFTIKQNYIIHLDSLEFDSITKLRYQLIEGNKISKTGIYGYSLTKTQADSVRTIRYLKKLEQRIEKKDMYDLRVFPYTKYYSWNLNNYGKLYIPKANDTLTLDTNTVKLYKQIIERFENNTLQIKNDSIFINQSHATHYIVKNNYYFVVGDNRDNAIDSRRWGYLPEKAIIGKQLFIFKKSN